MLTVMCCMAFGSGCVKQKKKDPVPSEKTLEKKASAISKGTEKAKEAKDKATANNEKAPTKPETKPADKGAATKDANKVKTNATPTTCGEHKAPCEVTKDEYEVMSCQDKYSQVKTRRDLVMSLLSDGKIEPAREEAFFHPFRTSAVRFKSSTCVINDRAYEQTGQKYADESKELARYFLRDEAKAYQCEKYETEFSVLVDRYAEANEMERAAILEQKPEVFRNAEDYIALPWCHPEMTAFVAEMLRDYREANGED